MDHVAGLLLRQVAALPEAARAVPDSLGLRAPLEGHSAEHLAGGVRRHGADAGHDREVGQGAGNEAASADLAVQDEARPLLDAEQQRPGGLHLVADERIEFVG